MANDEDIVGIVDTDINDSLSTNHIKESMRLTRKELNSKRNTLRSSLTREIARSSKLAQAQARDIINGSTRSIWVGHEEKHYGLVHAITRLTGKVIGSLGLDTYVRVEIEKNSENPMVTAYTDFDGVYLTVNVLKINLNDPDNIMKLINLIKGLVYHETAHLIWSYHPGMFIRRGMKSIDSTSGVTAVAEQIRVGRELIDKYGTEDIKTKYIGAVLESDRNAKALLFKAWNVLEDQRVDTAMCTVSPRMAKYFTECVLELNFNPRNPGEGWPHVVGRTYLPYELRQIMRRDAQRHKFAAMLPEMEDIVFEYRKCNDLDQMYKLVMRMAPLLFLWNSDEIVNPGGSTGSGSSGLDTHETHYSPGYEKEKQPVPDPSDAPSDVTLENKPGNTSSKSGNTDTEGAADGDKKADEHGGSPSGKSRDEAQKIADKYRANVTRTLMNEANEFIASINEVNNAPIKPERTRPMTADMIKDTLAVANGVRDVLDSLVHDTDPVWQFHRESGVLDPTTFLTRKPGDSDYWSDFDHYGNPGHDLAVSILLDNSGSMHDTVSTLSVCAVGIRKACEQLNIPCTVSTFSDTVRMFVSAETAEAAFEQVLTGGNTYIMDALNGLRDQRYGKNNHLVVILTDGEWGDVKDIRMWSTPGTRFIGVAYQMLKDRLSNKGFNGVVEMHDLDNFPKLVTQEIATYFR